MKKPKHHKNAIAKLSKADKSLAEVIKNSPEFDIFADSTTTPFAALARSIVFQQLSGKAAGTILGRFKKLYGKKKFPTPADVLKTSDEQMRAVGLSGSKVKALKDLAAKTLDGTLPSSRALNKLDDEAIIAHLTIVRGIGRWTVEMFLIFKMGRLDVLSTGDYGVRKGFAKVYKKRNLPSPEQLAKFGEKWKPYRSLATWYLWRSLEL
jgi:DNA-3-methyladenine glycosylase II